MADDLEQLAILPPCLANIEILGRDDDFLMIEKPSGLLSVPGRHPANSDSVLSRLRESYPTAEIVHRLDFDTSGIMVIPLTKQALSHISKQFQARSLRKEYIAVVDGLLEQETGVIDLPIAVDPENRPKYKISDTEGKKSVTEYSVIQRDELAKTTRVLLHPVTGRSHQLRLHLQAIGHPILGCVFYGNENSKQKAERLLLHATSIEFQHPTKGRTVKFIAPPKF